MVESAANVKTLEHPTVLLTGGSGFIGRNIVPILEQTNNLLAPARAELDLLDADALARYVEEHAVDVIVHAANPNPVKNPEADGDKDMFEASLRSFMNVFRLRDACSHILYFGSGAEYDKRRDIVQIEEDELASSVPVDAYGEAKFIMNSLAQNSGNVTNLRLFACYGPYDHDSKFITHCIRSVLLGCDIAIRQDCKFDYLHVSDLGRIVDYFTHLVPEKRDYNVASGTQFYLSEIAAIVLREMDSNLQIKLLKPDFNREYTASVDRLLDETKLKFMPLIEGIRLQIAHETARMGEWNKSEPESK